MSGKKETSTLARFLMTTACFVVAIWGLHSSQEFVVPFLLSVMVAALTAPPLFWLKSKGLPSWAALAVVLLVVIAGVVMVATVIGSSTSGFVAKKEAYGNELQEKLDMLYAGFDSMGWEKPEKVIVKSESPQKVREF